MDGHLWRAVNYSPVRLKPHTKSGQVAHLVAIKDVCAGLLLRLDGCRADCRNIAAGLRDASPTPSEIVVLGPKLAR
ncbi:MAG: hypothetical protein ACFCUQ_03685 [Kiloniellales bacterium]